MDRIALNRSDYSLLGGYFLLVSLWLALRFWVENYSFWEFIIDIPVALIQTLVLLWIAKKLIEYYFINSGRAIWFVVLSFLSLWLVGFLSMVSGDLSELGRIPWENYQSISELIVINIHSSVYNIALPLALISGKKYYENKLIVAELTHAKKDIELKLLQSQFDPHFLYNSLNTIDALVEYDSKEKVKRYVANLADLYRHLVQDKDEDVMPLEREISLGKSFLFLMQTRYENDYLVDFDLEKIPINKYLPNGAFLSVIENIFKHNKPLANGPLKINIGISENHLCVRNQKSNRSTTASKSNGTGLENLKKRYELLSNQLVEINNEDNHFEICLPLINRIE